MNTQLIKSIPKIYAVLPGRGPIDKLSYAFYKILAMFLVKRGVIWRNGVKRKMSEGRSTSVPEVLDRCKRIVCVTGFGHSGSGAMIDFLSEYANISATGVIDSPDGSLRKSIGEDFEFNLLTRFGGLFSLEDAIVDGRVADRDSTLKIFLALAADHYKPDGAILGEGFRSATKKFLNELIDYTITADTGYEYCCHLRGIGEDGLKLFLGDKVSMPIFQFKKMDRGTYRQIAKNYLSEVMSFIPSREILILDQVVSDLKGDIEKYRDYLGDIKLIAVYRDPRDVFATGLKLNVAWLPKKADEFVRWYKWNVPVENFFNRDNCLLVRFEDLILKYDKVESTVEKFLNLDHAKHTQRRTVLNPDISVKNVGLWKTVCGESDDIRYIEKELPERLYKAE